MRMEALTISTLLLSALVPSLLPSWRSVLIASGCFLALLFVGFASVLWHFGATSAEGPAFVGLVILVGLTTFILVFSSVVRLVVNLVLSNLTQTNAIRLRRFLIVLGLAFAGLAVVGVLEFSVHRGFAIMVGSASMWLVVVTWLMPNNSFKPNPLRGSA